jgi:hypothetical protein
MKAFFATLVTIGVLWFVDIEFNNGRYSAVVQRAFTSVLSR